MGKFTKSLFCILAVCTLFLGGCTNSRNENDSQANESDKVINSTEESDSNENINSTNENSTETNESDKVTTSTDETEVNENTNSESTKQLYLEKLDNLKADLKISLEEKYASPLTQDMIEGASEELKQWDDMLNEIYGKLENQLPKEEMDKLRVEELKWIETKDKKREEAHKEFEGGTMAPLNALLSLVDSTKSRCYELVNQYMK